MPLIRFRVRPKKAVESNPNMHIQKLTNDRLKQSVIGPFYRKLLRPRNWAPLEVVLETFYINNKLKSRVKYLFKKESKNAILAIHISRWEPWYFTVAKGEKVFESPQCFTDYEFDDALCKYFKKLRPILPRKEGF